MKRTVTIFVCVAIILVAEISFAQSGKTVRQTIRSLENSHALNKGQVAAD